jgi:membrane protein YqaA with SNARE-associated domain
MQLLLAVSDEIWTILRRLGGIGLILMGLLDSSIIPTPGGQDALTIVLAAGEKEWWPYYGFMATVGSVMGGYLTYRLGCKGGEELLEQRLSKRKIERVRRTFEKYGFGALFVPAILPPPVPISPFLLSAGVMNYPVKKFLLALAAGRTIRFMSVAYLGSLFGRQVLRFLGRHYMTILVGFIALAAAGGVIFLVYRFRRKKSQSPATNLGGG